MPQLTPVQTEFVEWMATPQGSRVPSTQEQFAKDHDVSPETVRRWKKTGWFREALDARFVELNIDPERIQQVVEAMWREAKGGDQRAAAIFFKYLDDVGAIQSKVEDRNVEDMTDEELQQAWDEVWHGS